MFTMRSSDVPVDPINIASRKILNCNAEPSVFFKFIFNEIVPIFVFVFIMLLLFFQLSAVRVERNIFLAYLGSTNASIEPFLEIGTIRTPPSLQHLNES